MSGNCEAAVMTWPKAVFEKHMALHLRLRRQFQKQLDRGRDDRRARCGRSRLAAAGLLVSLGDDSTLRMSKPLQCCHSRCLLATCARLRVSSRHRHDTT